MRNLMGSITTIRVSDFGKAKEFYGGVLGLAPLRSMAGGMKPLPADYPGYAAYDCSNGTGLLIYEGGPTHAESTLCAFSVGDLAEVMTDLRGKGITFEEYDYPGFKTVNGVLTDQYSKSAWFKDPDGNYLCVTEIL